MHKEFTDLESLDRKVASFCSRLDKDVAIISVAGGSGSGKSSQVANLICSSIQNSLGSGSFSLLSQDDFQIGRAFVDSVETKYKWDDPRNFDLEYCLKVLNEIKNGAKQLEIPVFNLEETKRIGVKKFFPRRIIVFEGIYSFLTDELSLISDLKIYVEAPLYARFLKRYFRFIYQHKIPKPRKAIEQMLGKVLLAHQKFVVKQKSKATIVVRTPFSLINLQQNLSIPAKDVQLGSSTSGEVIFCFEFAEGCMQVVDIDGKNYFIIQLSSGEILEIVLIDDASVKLFLDKDFLAL